MHDTSCTEEEEGLKEGMGHQVEDPGNKGTHTAGQEHIAQLADGGIGQNPFYIIGHHGNGGGKDSGQCTHGSHYRHGNRGQ